MSKINQSKFCSIKSTKIQRSEKEYKEICEKKGFWIGKTIPTNKNTKTK